MQTLPFDPTLAVDTLPSEQPSAESHGAAPGKEPSDAQVSELLRAKTLKLEDVADTQLDEPTSPPIAVDKNPDGSEVEVVEKPHKPLLEWRGHNSDEAIAYAMLETPKKVDTQMSAEAIQPQDSQRSPPEKLEPAAKLAQSEPVPESHVDKDKLEDAQSKPVVEKQLPQNHGTEAAGGDRQSDIIDLAKPVPEAIQQQDVATPDEVEIVAVKQSDRASLLSLLKDMNGKGLSLADAIEKLSADEDVEVGAIPVTTRMDQFKHKRQHGHGADGAEGDDDGPPAKRPAKRPAKGRGRGRGNGRGKGRGKGSKGAGGAEEVAPEADGAGSDQESQADVDPPEVPTVDVDAAEPKTKAKAKPANPKGKAKAKCTAKAKAKASSKKKGKPEGGAAPSQKRAAPAPLEIDSAEGEKGEDEKKNQKAGDQLGTEDEGSKKKPAKRPSFARRPVPFTAPASDRWHAIRNSFKDHVQPTIVSAGGTVYCWEEPVAVIKSGKTFFFQSGLLMNSYVVMIAAATHAPGALVQLRDEGFWWPGH